MFHNLRRWYALHRSAQHDTSELRTTKSTMENLPNASAKLDIGPWSKRDDSRECGFRPARSSCTVDTASIANKSEIE